MFTFFSIYIMSTFITQVLGNKHYLSLLSHPKMLLWEPVLMCQLNGEFWGLELLKITAKLDQGWGILMADT